MTERRGTGRDEGMGMMERRGKSSSFRGAASGSVTGRGAEGLRRGKESLVSADEQMRELGRRWAQ